MRFFELSYNHAAIVLEYGLHWDYGGLPVFVTSFWTGLTFIDPLAAILLLTRLKPGLALTVAVIGSDVAANSRAGLTYGFDIPASTAQVLFLIFVLSIVRIAWRTDDNARALTEVTHTPPAKPPLGWLHLVTLPSTDDKTMGKWPFSLQACHH